EMPESKYARPVVAEPRAEGNDFGPPPGYEPILLPGESISKYRKPQTQSGSHAPAVVAEQTTPAIAQSFPDDEPGFAGPPVVADAIAVTEQHEEVPVTHREVIETQIEHVAEDDGPSPWNREQQSEQQKNVAAIFGEPVVDEEEVKSVVI